MSNLVLDGFKGIRLEGCEVRVEDFEIVVVPKRTSATQEIASELISVIKQGLKTGVVNPKLDEGADLRQLSKKQQCFIAGLTEKLGLDRSNLPAYLSEKSDYHDMTEAEASYLIDRLVAIRGYQEELYNQRPIKCYNK